MFFARIFKPVSSLSQRILLRIVTLLSLTYIFFFIILFFVLKEFLAVKDQNLAKSKHAEISTLLNQADINSIDKILNDGLQKEKIKGLLINIIGPDHITLYYQLPDLINHFNKETIDYELHKKSNFKGSFRILPKDIGHETIEVYADKIQGNVNLMVGINTDESEDFLWSFVNSFFLLIIFLSFIAIITSYLYLKKSLKPIRELINTIKSVQNGRVSELPRAKYGEDEIEELNVVFNDMVKHTNKILDSFQYSIDSIAHDLRTPVSNIINCGQLAIKSNDSELCKETLYFVINELIKISTLLATIMDISENEAGSTNLNYTRFDIKELLEECLEIFEYASNEKEIIISISDFNKISIMAERNRIKQVFINLISNSVKYSDSVVKIDISVKVSESFIKIVFKDDGWGMSPNDQKRVWERLYRGDKSRSSSGMGLGLTLVKSIINLHQGEILLESQIGVGSIFTIILPIAL